MNKLKNVLLDKKQARAGLVGFLLFTLSVCTCDGLFYFTCRSEEILELRGGGKGRRLLFSDNHK